MKLQIDPYVITGLSRKGIDGDSGGGSILFFQGTWDASSGTLPTTRSDGSQIVKGDMRVISVGGTVSGLEPEEILRPGDMILATADNPSDVSGWTAIQGNIEWTNLPVENGLYNDNGVIKLGGNLTETTIIDTNGNTFNLGNGNEVVLETNPDGTVGLAVATVDYVNTQISDNAVDASNGLHKDTSVTPNLIKLGGTLSEYTEVNTNGKGFKLGEGDKYITISPLLGMIMSSDSRFTIQGNTYFKVNVDGFIELDALNGNYIRLSADADLSTLAYHPTGNVALAIATVGYVNDTVTNAVNNVTTIYTGDGALEGSRTITGDNRSYGLTFDEMSEMHFNADTFITFEAGDEVTFNSNVTVNSSNILNVAKIVASNPFTFTIVNDSTTATIVDTRTTRTGLEYADDYSATFTDRSLVDKGYVDSAIGQAVDPLLKSPDGFATTSTGDYPTDYKGTGTVSEGDTFVVTDTTNGTTVGTQTVNVGDFLIAKVDNPGNDDVNWLIVESNRDKATEDILGVTEIATQAEVDAGSDDFRYITPLKLRTWANSNLALAQNGLTKNGQYIELGGNLNRSTLVRGNTDVGGVDNHLELQNYYTGVDSDYFSGFTVNGVGDDNAYVDRPLSMIWASGTSAFPGSLNVTTDGFTSAGAFVSTEWGIGDGANRARLGVSLGTDTDFREIYASNSELAINYDVSGYTRKFYINNSGAFFESNVDNVSGTIQYAGDYESRFGLRTLVTKQYVDNAITNNTLTADNGININTTTTPGVIELGGALNKNTQIDVNSNVLQFIGDSGAVSVTDNGIEINSANASYNYEFIVGNGSGALMLAFDSTNTTYNQITVLESDINIKTEITQAGMHYDADYSANNTGANDNPRWIPDKAYVDSVVANSALQVTNGLTKDTSTDPDTIKLGGTLVEDTNLEGTDVVFNIISNSTAHDGQFIISNLADVNAQRSGVVYLSNDGYVESYYKTTPTLSEIAFNNYAANGGLSRVTTSQDSIYLEKKSIDTNGNVVNGIAVTISTENILIDSAQNNGAYYNADYSANNTGTNYNPRWIPDLEAVVNYTSNLTPYETDLTADVAAGSVAATLPGTIVSDKIKVYINGIRQKGADFSLNTTNGELTTNIDLHAGDNLIVDYYYI